MPSGRRNIKCPACSTTKVSKFGFSGEGKQRFLCNNAKCDRKTFIVDYSYNGCKQTVKNQIIKLIDKEQSIRSISKKLGISTNTVIAEKKEYEEELC